MPERASNWIHEIKWPEIAAYLKTDDIVLIPVGATEQHGDHLPLMVDTGWATGMAEGAAELANVLIAPPIHYGWGPHHMAYPGTITLSADTLTSLCVDVGQSLAFHGFKKLVFVNGNRAANLPPMEIAASKLRFRTGAFAAVVDAGLIAKNAVYDVCESGPGGLGHGGESETAYTLHHNPHLVDMSKATKAQINHPPFHTGHTSFEAPFHRNSVFVARTDAEFGVSTRASSGITGDATVATAEKGARIHEIITRALADFIAEQVRPAQVAMKEVAIPS
jgi:creatinine amidohydrolase